MKIDKLTKEQSNILQKTKSDWLNLAFEKNADGINKQLFEDSINWLYKDLLKMESPKIVYCDSWTSCLLEIDSIRKDSQQVKYRLNPLRLIVREAVQKQVLTPIRKQIEESVNESVFKIVEESLYEMENLIQYNICVQVSNSIINSILPHEGSPTKDFSDFIDWDSFRMIAGYDFFERIGVFSNTDFTQFKNILQSNVFTIYEYENIVFAIQPPSVIERNSKGELHSLEKRAFEFPDGFGYYFINGQLMPDWIFMGFEHKDIDEMEDENIKLGMKEVYKLKRN